MPTLDEIGKRLGLSKAEQKSLIRLVDERGSRRSAVSARKRGTVSAKALKSMAANVAYSAKEKNERACEATA